MSNLFAPKPYRRIATSKSRLLRGSAAGICAVVVVGGVAVVELRKDVVVSVDGENTELVTYSRDVADVLDQAGVELSERDVLDRELDDAVSNGETVTVTRAREVTMEIDGRPATELTTANTVGEFVAGRADIPEGAHLSPGPGLKIPEEGLDLTVVSPIDATVADAGQEPVELSSPGRTVGDFLARAGLGLGPDDIVEPAADATVEPGTVITVTRIESEDHTETESFGAPEERIEDPELDQGEREVVEPGSLGERELRYRLVTVNGVESEREFVGERIVREAEPAVVRVGTGAPEPSSASGADGGVWDQIAQCESGGDWSIDTGNGFQGGLQFHPQTWAGHGGTEYAPTANQASREQQIAVAERVLASQGWGAWPACTAQMGLR